MAATLERTEAQGRLDEVLRDSKDWPYHFEIVPVKYLFVDEYQRPLTSFKDDIAKAFDPALVGTIVVSKRSKTKYAVVDGQTRTEGAREAGVTELPCIVYELNFEQEADLFAKFQTQRRGMSSSDRFKAQVHAGGDRYPDQVAIDKITRKMGFEVGTNVGVTNNVIAAPAALEFVYRGATQGQRKSQPSPELLERVLEVVAEAWPKKPVEARSSLVIRGLGWFLKERGDDVDQGRLIDRLQRVQPSELAKRASSLREGRGSGTNSPVFMAEAIAGQYARR